MAPALDPHLTDPHLTDPHPTDPDPTDTVACLTRDDVQQLVLYFGGCLPPPLGDTAADRARRDNAALAQVASLRPANAEEMWLAARYVAAGAQADDQLRLVHLHAANFEHTRQINAQYALMVRTSGGARSLLLRVQTARRRFEADAAARAEGAALAAGLLALLLGTRAACGEQIEAGAEVAAQAAAEVAAQAAAAAAEAKAAPRAAQRPAWAMGAPEPMPEPVPMTEEEERRERWLIKADKFATIFPMRTRLIRRFGKLPDDCGIEQPEPEMLEAIRTGDRYSLRWADGLTKAEANQNAGKDRFLCEYEDAADREAAGPEAVESG